MSMNPELVEVLRARGDVWSAAEHIHPRTLRAARGDLGGLLPEGWPRGQLVEVLTTGPGFGEASLFMALAAELTTAGREVAWVAPEEGVPNAPALAAAGLDLDHFLWVRTADRNQAAWVARELLASGAVPLVLVSREPGDARALRGLALAARDGDALGVLLRDAARRENPSPAQLRLEFPPEPRKPRRLVVLKGRDIAPGTPIALEG